MKLSGELSYRIGYDVEHDLFHAQNVFNDEYIPPTFIEYVQKLEKENKVLAQNLEDTEIVNKALEKENAEVKEKLNKIERKCKFNFVDLLHDVENESKQEEQLTKAKEIIKKLMEHLSRYVWIGDNKTKPAMEKDITEAEQFLNSEVEK